MRGERACNLLERLISSHFHVYVISVVLALSLSTGRVTTAWAFASKSFPEIDYDKVDRVRGLDTTITTSAGSDE
ncbi:hypothetical protein OK016_07230 [Vibrio chagasii]|nr:hypothetical protein [Vibrio chagasii]